MEGVKIFRVNFIFAEFRNISILPARRIKIIFFFVLRVGGLLTNFYSVLTKEVERKGNHYSDLRKAFDYCYFTEKI